MNQPIRVIYKRKNWPRKYKEPPVFPVVLNERDGLIHDFNRTFPLRPDTFYKEGTILDLNLKSHKGSIGFIKTIANYKDCTLDDPYEIMNYMLENSYNFTDSFILMFAHIIRNRKQRFDINLQLGLANLKNNQTPHSLRYFNLDLTDREKYRRNIILEGEVGRWIGYTCILTSLYGGFTGVGTIVAVDDKGLPLIDCEILSGNKPCNKGKIFPMFKRKVKDNDI